jgi:single-strand DNA-binding protein
MATKRTTPKTVEETAPEQAERRWRGPSENRVSLIGRLVADPEIRQTPNGKQVASFRVATNDPFGVEYHSIVAWEKLAQIAGTVLAKGRLVHIEGRLHGSTWQASDGTKRRTVEIIAGRLQALDAKPAAEVEAA